MVRVAIIVPLVAMQNMAEAGAVEPPLEEVRYTVLVAAVLVEHLQTMVLLEGHGQAMP